ncbi:hypothetical protein T440DRAFT_528313 [Plenodomus tracheiphilus IPT5]|uniref:DUF4604 domain-containing protein n=1 Tax=Plenodomus tracheiphilus IPT5 TaxID=1408161 RepID=A0A6A7B8V5_9PLEO|nr:hypothetical protein T440DRAFT_528313 [Plenodomus tracheiphilus IPT5]
MSFKAKDLHFDSSQPAFLQRLRGQLQSGDSARHEQPVARNKRAKDNDEDDAPTYVMEDTNQSLTKEEYEALVSGKDSNEGEHSSGKEESTNLAADDGKSIDKIVEVGGNVKKRKAAKIISDEHDETTTQGRDVNKSNSKFVKKTKKKAKAVKLTFGNEEEG